MTVLPLTVHLPLVHYTSNDIARHCHARMKEEFSVQVIFSAIMQELSFSPSFGFPFFVFLLFHCIAL